MFPLPISMWVSIASVVLAIAGFGYGKYESNKYDQLKVEVAAAAKVQEAKNESIVKQQDLINKGIKNDYESKLSAIRNYYSGLQRNAGSGKLPSLSNPSSGTNESTAYYQLAESCSETTVQTLALQDWILQQTGIK